MLQPHVSIIFTSWQTCGQNEDTLHQIKLGTWANSHTWTHKHLNTHSNTPMADHSTYSKSSNCFQMSKLSSPPFASLRLHFGSCVFSLRSTAKLRTHSSCVFVCVYELLHLEISSMWYNTLTGVISKEEEIFLFFFYTLAYAAP